MIRKLLLSSISILVSICYVQAQDLIVTSRGDSINCKITKTTRDYIYFTFKHEAEIRNTLIPLYQISTHQKDYFSVSELPVNYTLDKKFPHFRVAFDGGWQYRTAKIADGLDSEWREHYKKMKSGFHYDLQASYFFIESMGIEAVFSQQFFGNTGDGYLKDEEGNFTALGKIKDQISFNYIGANYLLRLFDSKKKNCWLFSIGFGYMGYKDRLFFDNVEQIKITTGTLGSSMAVGYDIGISQNFGIGFKLSLMGGTFRDYKQTKDGITTNETMPEKQFEGLGTIKLSIGLRFNK